jgi:hypothetical protein
MHLLAAPLTLSTSILTPCPRFSCTLYLPLRTQAYIKAKYEHKTFALRLRKPPLIKPAPDPAPDDLLGPVSPRSRGAEGMVEYIVSEKRVVPTILNALLTAVAHWCNSSLC